MWLIIVFISIGISLLFNLWAIILIARGEITFNKRTGTISVDGGKITPK